MGHMADGAGRAEWEGQAAGQRSAAWKSRGGRQGGLSEKLAFEQRLQGPESQGASPGTSVGLRSLDGGGWGGAGGS